MPVIPRVSSPSVEKIDRQGAFLILTWGRESAEVRGIFERARLIVGVP